MHCYRTLVVRAGLIVLGIVWLVSTAQGIGAQSLPGSAQTVGSAAVHRYYVAVNGSDSNPGTIEKPFKTWAKAWSVVAAGDFVYIRGGVYYPPNLRDRHGAELLGKNGTAAKPIRFFAYPGEKPVLDCSTVTYIGSDYAGVYFRGNHCHFKGLEIRGIVQRIDPRTGYGYACKGFFAYDSNDNVFEDLDVHHNGGSGFQMTGRSTNNLILNCDFHHNYDPYSYNANGKPYPGGNADGCEISAIVKGCANIVQGCRFWWNSDDGLDLWRNEGSVVVRDCWSFWNGYVPGTFTASGDGAGYKLGKTFEAMDNHPQRTVVNCVAYANRTNGFEQSDGNVLMVFYNNIAYRNSGLGFQLSNYHLRHVFRNNISYANYRLQMPDSRIAIQSDQSHNTWNGFIVTDADFLSIDPRGIDGTRTPESALPKTRFLRLAVGSPLVDAGTNTGLPFSGKAPDLGAFEHGSSAEHAP